MAVLKGYKSAMIDLVSLAGIMARGNHALVKKPDSNSVDYGYALSPTVFCELTEKEFFELRCLLRVKDAECGFWRSLNYVSNRPQSAEESVVKIRRHLEYPLTELIRPNLFLKEPSCGQHGKDEQEVFFRRGDGKRILISSKLSKLFNPTAKFYFARERLVPEVVTVDFRHFIAPIRENPHSESMRNMCIIRPDLLRPLEEVPPNQSFLKQEVGEGEVRKDSHEGEGREGQEAASGADDNQRGCENSEGQPKLRL